MQSLNRGGLEGIFYSMRQGPNLDYVTTHHAGVSEPDALSSFFLFYTRPGPSSLLQSAVTAGRTQAPMNVAKYQKHRTIEWVGL